MSQNFVRFRICSDFHLVASSLTCYGFDKEFVVVLEQYTIPTPCSIVSNPKASILRHYTSAILNRQLLFFWNCKKMLSDYVYQVQNTDLQPLSFEVVLRMLLFQINNFSFSF